MTAPFFLKGGDHQALPFIAMSTNNKKQQRRFRLWKPSSLTSTIARTIVLVSFCLTLAVVTTTVRYGNKTYHEQFLLLRRRRSLGSAVAAGSESSQLLLSNNNHGQSSRRLTDRSLRVLALGGPSTGGQGLSDPLDAYPYQLSVAAANNNKPQQYHLNVHNYAATQLPQTESTQTTATTTGMAAASAAAAFSHQQQILSSLCTQSIVGDTNVYDVIVLQYETVDAPALSLLVQRLRNRFPRSLLVFVQLWSPSLDIFTMEHGMEVSLADWRMRQQQQQQPQQSETLIEWSDQDAMLQALQLHLWYLRERPEEDATLEHILQGVDGVLYRLPRPLDVNENLRDVLLGWFDEKKGGSDGNTSPHYTLSQTAHKQVSSGLNEIVHQEIEKRSMENPAVSTSSYSDAFPQLGTWGSGDSCQLWYETGKVLSQQQHSRGLQHKEFSHHHALEVVAPKGGSLQVHNPFAEDRVVYLTYMTTSANASSKKVYPRTKVRAKGNDNGDDASHIVLDPSHDDNRDVSHRTRTSAVGVVPAGATIELEFTPLEEYTLNKFRIVGVSFLAKEKVAFGISSEFAMVSSQGLVVDDEEKDGSYATYHHGGGPAFSFSGWWGKVGGNNNNTNSFTAKKTLLSLESASSSTSDDRSPQ